MSNCVNFNSPDVVKLAGELNVSPAVAAAKIGLYQDKNGLDKFPTVDELNNTKTGVNNVFKENKELSNIGTQQQYSQYLDTIFPDSKVKDIVYHATIYDFDKFDSNKLGTTTGNYGFQGKGFYFYKKANNAKTFIDSTLKTNSKVISVVVNSINPFTNTRLEAEKIGYEYNSDVAMYTGLGNKDKTEKFNISLEKERFDSVIDGEELNVFEPEQIHILSSKKDLEMFKKYVDELQQPNEVVDELKKEFDFTNIIDDSLETIFSDTKSETITQSEDNQNHKLLFSDENIKTLSAGKVLTNLISSDKFNNSKDEAFFLERLMNLLGKSLPSILIPASLN